MKKRYLFLIMLFILLFQTSCDDDWYEKPPETEESKYAKITIKCTGKWFCSNAVLHDVTTGAEYNFPYLGYYDREATLKVQAGTYYITAEGFSAPESNLISCSGDFTVGERDAKIIIYSQEGYSSTFDGKFIIN